MTYTPPTSATALGTLTVTQYNTQVKGNIEHLYTSGTATQGSVTATQGSVTTRTGIFKYSYLQIPVWRFAGTAENFNLASNITFTSNDNSYYCFIQSIDYALNKNNYVLGYTDNNGVSFSFPNGTTGSGLSTVSSNLQTRCSSNGSVIYLTYADSSIMNIYKSTNAGTTFSSVSSAGTAQYRDLCCSLSGSVIYAKRNGIAIVSSRDQGATWSTASFGTVTSISCSGNGTVAFATVNSPTSLFSGSVVTTTNGGLTWTNTSANNNNNWLDVSCSSNGSVVVAVRRLTPEMQYSYPAISQDGGTTWSDLISAGLEKWEQVAISQDGTKITVKSINKLISSVDMGNTFYQEDIKYGFWPKTFLPSGSALISDLAIPIKISI